jgi:hypothetical protein
MVNAFPGLYSKFLESTMSDTIALMWDCNGLEAAVNVSSIRRRLTWAVLKGEDTREIPVEPNLLHWQLRAQFNPQRHYEIYLLEVSDGVTVEDIREAFESAPQEMADTVRRIGHEFYSDRATQKRVIV